MKARRRDAKSCVSTLAQHALSAQPQFHRQFFHAFVDLFLRNGMFFVQPFFFDVEFVELVFALREACDVTLQQLFFFFGLAERAQVFAQARLVLRDRGDVGSERF